MDSLFRNSSIPYFFPNSDWAPPAIAPDRPEALPDCSRMVVMTPMLNNTCNTIKIVLK
jgi:hypothetical protein